MRLKGDHLPTLTNRRTSLKRPNANVRAHVYKCSANLKKRTQHAQLRLIRKSHPNPGLVEIGQSAVNSSPTRKAAPFYQILVTATKPHPFPTVLGRKLWHALQHSSDPSPKGKSSMIVYSSKHF